MLQVSETAILPQAPAQLFAIAADPFQQLEWDSKTLTSVTALTSDPLGQGSRYRGAFKGFGTVEYEFAEFEPGRCFTHCAAMKMGVMRHTFTFEAVPEGTRLTQVGQLQPNLVGWVMQPMMARMLRKRFREIADELQQYRPAGAS